jgi:hypothetical protein
MRGWMLVWDLFWFPAGLIVDAITGAWYRLEPEQVTVTLTKLSSDLPGPESIEIYLSKGMESNSISVQAPETVSVNVRNQQ